MVAFKILFKEIGEYYCYECCEKNNLSDTQQRDWFKAKANSLLNDIQTSEDIDLETKKTAKTLSDLCRECDFKSPRIKGYLESIRLT